MTVSVIIPVKNGKEYLAELLSALEPEGADEVLVIDSGSETRRSRSREGSERSCWRFLRRSSGTVVPGILAAERTSGDLICFLTQDATPLPGWLAAYREAFALAPRIGAAYGPHVPRPDASPMIARELEEFFASFSPVGVPVVQQQGDPTFLSNVNACYSRPAGSSCGSANVAYAEDQAFGADLLDAGWSKVYHPGAAVLHSHDYGFVDFMRRYFDEYRGLRETTGHIEPFAPRDMVGHIQRSVRGDMQWLRQRRRERRVTRQLVLAVGRPSRWADACSRPLARGLTGYRRPLAAGSHSRGAMGAAPLAATRRGRGRRRDRGIFPSTRCEDRAAGAEHEFYAQAARVWREAPRPCSNRLTACHSAGGCVSRW